jgi:hypothetical protein
MGVLLQGFFKKLPNNAVPSPADGDDSLLWWWDRLAVQANALRLAGFTALWLPPVTKSASGANVDADGYGPFDDYDIGSRHQKGSTPTRFGIREQLQRCVAIFRANGIDVYVDLVEHHRLGDTTPFVFRYPGADGTPDIGRFPKNPSNFLPQVPRDSNLGGQPADDFPFGRELAPINAKPPHYVFDNLVDAADWITRSLGIQGYRLDDVKGLSTDFLHPLLTSKSMAGKFAVGEFFDGNPTLVNGWIFNPVGMQGRPSAFDFPLKFLLNAMCNNPGRFNMADLDHAGLTGISPLNAVTFVENHDTDLSASQRIVFNKILGYAYILTSEGYPCVYYRDYSTDPDCYGLKAGIDNLIWIHEKLANGPTLQRWKDFNVFAYERLGGSHLLVGLNNDPGNVRVITVATGFGPNVPLHDYTGHSGDTTTDGNGNVTITIPVNNNGTGYVCYSRSGQGGGFPITTVPVNQDFEGAIDLDIPPAFGGQAVEAGRVWCAANSAIKLNFKPDRSGWTSATQITLELIAPDGSVRASQTAKLDSSANTTIASTTAAEGYYTLRLLAANTPATNANPAFTLSTTYSAPQLFTPKDAQGSIPPDVLGDPSLIGRWSEIINLANVPIHTHVLPSGKVLFWGRRNPPGTPDFPSLNQQECVPFIWDPATRTVRETGNRPVKLDGTPINLFCSGHTLLADGRLFVVGGHIVDSSGIDCSTVYDPLHDRWTAAPIMKNGRWYPTAITLPDGTVFVSSGSFAQGGNFPVNNVPERMHNGSWSELQNFNQDQGSIFPLFPRMHVAPDGRLFMSGGLGQSFFFDPDTGVSTPSVSRAAGTRDYAPAVMYDTGKIAFIGGGLDIDTQAPTNTVETIDLTSAAPVWIQTNPMHFARRQHNAVILADGTVLVTGGTQGDGFNNLAPGQPVHVPELWNPTAGTWTQMAPESVDRCYHSTSVLLPDGTVFSGGGGEYAPTPGTSNPPVDSHSNAQIFSPPYLFKGERPIITHAPDRISYGQPFEITTTAAAEIDSVTWIRLSSVTHSFDQNQRIVFLAFTRQAAGLTVIAPANGNVSPPGHYMLFILNKQKVPSVAAIIQIGASVADPLTPLPGAVAAAFVPLEIRKTTAQQDADIQASEPSPPVVAGITPTCPYGLSACWAGAFDALKHLQGVRLVRPLPNPDDCTAYLYLKDGELPNIGLWRRQFASLANGTHIFRGVEVTLQGKVSAKSDGSLVLAATNSRPMVFLEPIQALDKIQWDINTRALKPLTADEQNAFAALQEQVRVAGGSLDASITGPFKISGQTSEVEVRKFAVCSPAIRA